MPTDLLMPLIMFKTRLKLLWRLFLNHNLGGYLHGLSIELDENTNSIRVELNRLEQVGILLEGRRKHCHINEWYRLTEKFTAIARRVSDVDTSINLVGVILLGLDQVRICGKLAKEVLNDQIEGMLIVNCWMRPTSKN